MVILTNNFFEKSNLINKMGHTGFYWLYIPSKNAQLAEIICQPYIMKSKDIILISIFADV